VAQPLGLACTLMIVRIVPDQNGISGMTAFKKFWTLIQLIRCFRDYPDNYRRTGRPERQRSTVSDI
jgi:hypothetical protein